MLTFSLMFTRKKNGVPVNEDLCWCQEELKFLHLLSCFFTLFFINKMTQINKRTQKIACFGDSESTSSKNNLATLWQCFKIENKILRF